MREPLAYPPTVTLSANHGALWVLSLCIGILVGLFAREIVNGPDGQGGAQWDPPTATESRNSGPSPTPHEVVIVLATVAPSPTVTPYAPQPTATATMAGDFCSTPTPGSICRWPLPPPPTATAYARCTSATEPGDWCRWDEMPTPTNAPDVSAGQDVG